MWRAIATGFALALLSASPSLAQLAMPVQPGYETIFGCPSANLTPCFVPFIAADSGPKVGTGAVNSSSHAAGTSVGGLITIPIAKVNGGSGIIANLLWTSPGGSTVALTIRIWDKNPSNTTCADNANFSGSAIDDANLVTAPFTIVPNAPGSTQGDAKTYSAVNGVTWDYRNADATASTNVYLCAVANATDTADESTTVSASLSGPQNPQ